MVLKYAKRMFRRLRRRDLIQILVVLLLVFIVFLRRKSGHITEKGKGNDEEPPSGDTKKVTPALANIAHVSSNRFLIISNGRSGTHLLMHLLNNHPELKTYGELLQTEIILKPKGIMGNKTAILEYLSKELCKLKKYCEQNRKVGFILLNWQISKMASFLTLDDILEHMGNPKIIVQYRVNTLMSYSSLQINKATGVANANVPNRNITVEINWRSFENFVKRKRIEWGDTLKYIANRTKIFITYEELVAKQYTSIGRMFEYIGVSEYRGTLSAKITKLNPTSLEERISNYEEVKEDMKEAPKKLLQLNLATEHDVTTIYDDDEIN